MQLHGEGLATPSQRSLLAAVADADTLASAWERIRAKNSAGGVDRISVATFAEKADDHLAALRRELLNGSYEPAPLLEIKIPKSPGKSGMRTLHLPTVRDKIAQEAVRTIIGPRIDRLFLDCSYGYREKKGPARAIARVNHYIASMGRRWAVTADIDEFFATLNLDRLLEQFARVVPDPDVVRLVTMWCRMGAIGADLEWHDAAAGVHQGNVLSPLLANLYLHPFDKAMTARGAGLVRYADDFVILCTEQREAEAALVAATEFLAEKLGLTLNQNENAIRSIEDGICFLGVSFRGAERSIDPKKLLKAEATLAQLVRRSAREDFAGILTAYNATVAGWRRYYGTVLSGASVAPLDQLATAALARCVAAAVAAGRLQAGASGAPPAWGIESVLKRSLAQMRIVEKDAWKAAKEIVREFKAAPGAVAGNNKLPKLRAVAARSAIVVRKRKRAHYRTAASTSQLVVNTPGSFVGKSAEFVVVRRERKVVARVRARELRTITIGSRGVAISADVVEHCAANDISLLFVTPRGELTGALAVPAGKDAHAGMLQLDAINRVGPALEIARRFVEGKIRNQFNLVKSLYKYRRTRARHAVFAAAYTKFSAAMRQLRGELKSLLLEKDLTHERARLMSVEGRAAAHYWEMIGHALLGRAAFSGRVRRGAKDLVNSMLNYGYAILESRVYLAVVGASLLPHAGFLHAFRPGNTALVYDLMEEFRPHVVDRTVVTMLCRGEPAAVDAEGMLSAPSRNRLAKQVLERLATVVDFRGVEAKLEEVVGRQARGVVKWLRGEGVYRPYVARW